MVRTPALHAGNPGSNPGGVTKEKQIFYLTNVRLVNLKTALGALSIEKR